MQGKIYIYPPLNDNKISEKEYVIYEIRREYTRFQSRLLLGRYKRWDESIVERNFNSICSTFEEAVNDGLFSISNDKEKVLFKWFLYYIFPNLWVKPEVFNFYIATGSFYDMCQYLKNFSNSNDYLLTALIIALWRFDNKHVHDIESEVFDFPIEIKAELAGINDTLKITQEYEEILKDFRNSKVEKEQ